MSDKPSVTFPPEFIKTKYPGYFFNTANNKLYSIKIDGVLKPLAFQKPNRFNHLWRLDTKGGYNISVKGRKRTYLIEDLKRLEVVDSVIPVRERR